MNIRFKFFNLSLVLLPCAIGAVTQAADFTGQFSMLGTTARATQDDNTLTADQQSLRLMLDNSSARDKTLNEAEWSVHMKMVRLHLSDFLFSDIHSSDLFRYEKLSSYWLEENDANNTSRFGYEIDRAVYKHRFKNTTLAIGRQSIDWGSGRFWQPLNVFGSFAPTDLDTDFKPGIDAARLDWFPSGFSSLTAVYVFSPNDNAAVDNNSSAALHYRRQVGEQSELKLLGADIIGNTVFAASFESAWGGMGWRLEAAHTQTKQNETSVFSIAGLDYQFSNGTLLAAEWYNNSRGANDITTLMNSNILTDTFIKYGLQQHLSQNVLGVSLNKDITPLMNAGYTLLASPVKDIDGTLNTSLLHQVNLIYSVSNESDLLFSLQFANGRGKTNLGQVQSEFGHVPTSITIRLRFYF
ncbi:MAG: hypothetical protein OQK75_08990 [Gammaproteobacteria bacterium]|nr:hypothetical protein [Gammaproteobacteria bacterium]MCW8987786.1 hypothetical protein [Gammaproteobacteria bacterium]